MDSITLTKEVQFSAGPIQLGRMIVQGFDLNSIGGMVCTMLASERGKEIFEAIKEEMEYHEGLYA